MNKESTHKQPAQVVSGIETTVVHVPRLTVKKLADKLLEIEKDAIAACFLNRVYYGALSDGNGRDFGTTLLQAIAKGSSAHKESMWNSLMVSDVMKSSEDLVASLPNAAQRDHFRLSCESAARMAGKTRPIQNTNLGNKASAAFNQATNSPPSPRFEKIGHLGAHSFYGMKAGREAQ